MKDKVLTAKPSERVREKNGKEKEKGKKSSLSDSCVALPGEQLRQEDERREGLRVECDFCNLEQWKGE